MITETMIRASGGKNIVVAQLKTSALTIFNNLSTMSEPARKAVRNKKPLVGIQKN